MSANIVKKISIKTLLGGKPSARMVPDGQTEKVLARIWGIASGLKSGVSDYGDWTALTGDFKASNLKDGGEVVRSGVAFVPDVLLQMIQPRVEQGQTVEFAFDVLIKPDESSATGYVYNVRPVIDMPLGDVMERLEAQIAALALPTPAPETPQKETHKKSK